MMVKYHKQLDRTFAALGDRTRRDLVSRLGGGSLTISELARPLPMSLPAAIKHLDVLIEAGLITRVKSGRTVTCSLSADPIGQAASWLDAQQRVWNEKFDRLDIYLHRIQHGDSDERPS